MKKAEKRRLTNNWQKAQEIWFSKRDQFGLQKWKLVACRMDDKVGLCNYRKKTLFLSTVFLRGANCNYNKVRKSLIHEIAHALCPGNGHDEVWKRTCQKLGGDDRLACTMMQPGRNWSMYCRVCKWRQEYLTKPRVEGMRCSTCGTQPRVKAIH